MIQEIACLLRNDDCKEILRATKITELKITFFQHIKDLVTKVHVRNYELLLIEESQISKDFLQCISEKDLNHSTIIITPEFNKHYFQKYVKLGFRYIIDTETFIYLIPTILENLEEFLHNQNCTDRKITRKGVTVSISMGYLIFHDCKIIASRLALIVLTILLKSDGYRSLFSLQSDLQRQLGERVTESHITVIISRLNHDIYKATGMRIIKKDRKSVV